MRFHAEVVKSQSVPFFLQKMIPASASGDLRPPDSYRGFAPGHHCPMQRNEPRDAQCVAKNGGNSVHVMSLCRSNGVDNTCDQ